MFDDPPLLASLVCVFLFGNVQVSSGQQIITATPGDNLQAFVDQYPAGTTFSFAAGIYRLQSVLPKSHDSFVGQTGAILSGAALLSDFSESDTYWIAHVQVSQAASYPGQCGSANPACTFPEDLFFDNVLKTRVTNLTAVGPGTWCLDYSSGSVYMGDDPSGHTVEMSLLGYAFSGTAQSVTITDLIVEKYACVAGSGAIDASQGTYGEVGYDEVRYNHDTGIRTGDGMYVHDNKIHNNGDLSIGGFGTFILVQNNEISFNNYSGYSIYWEAGGAKFISLRIAPRGDLLSGPLICHEENPLLLHLRWHGVVIARARSMGLPGHCPVLPGSSARTRGLCVVLACGSALG